MLAELNRLRADPQEYAQELEALRAHYHGKLFFRDEGAPIRTEEGVAALDEAIVDVKAARPAPALSTSLGLALAARDQVVDEGPTGAVGHRGTGAHEPPDATGPCHTGRRDVDQHASGQGPGQLAQSLVGRAGHGREQPQCRVGIGVEQLGERVLVDDADLGRHLGEAVLTLELTP